MKKTKIIYWTSTILFAGFMGLGALGDLIQEEEAVKMITGLGYPAYFVPFIGFAKLLGCIAILIPQFKKIKEWAYAGFFFDLVGATYSAIMAAGWDNQMLFMILPFGFGTLSYLYNQKVNGDYTTA